MKELVTMEIIQKNKIWISIGSICFFIIFFLSLQLFQNKIDQDSLLLHFMTSGYSSEQYEQFMQIAQQQAKLEKTDCISLRHYERAFAQMKYGKLGFYNKLVHKLHQFCKGVDVIAYHEASHTVLAVYKDCGLDLKWTSIELCQSMLGYVYSFNYYKKTHQQKIHTVMMLLAGGIGEQLYTHKKFKNNEAAFADFLRRMSASGDIQTARLILNEIFRDSQLSEQYIDELLKQYYLETRQFLHEHWNDVSCVAQKLLEQKFLSCYNTYKLLK